VPRCHTPRSHILPVTIAGHQVLALRHTMAGNPGCEFWGPWDEGLAVKEAILKAGESFEMRRVGSLAYFTNAIELGWIPRPVPAIFTGDELRPFREWLPATAGEATWAIGGSLNAPNIDDYYFTPWELGYGNVVKFDHDFVGREALERSAGDDHRKKVTLVWDPADVAALFESYMHPDELPGLYPSCREPRTRRGSTTRSRTTKAARSGRRTTPLSSGTSGRCCHSPSSNPNTPSRAHASRWSGASPMSMAPIGKTWNS